MKRFMEEDRKTGCYVINRRKHSRNNLSLIYSMHYRSKLVCVRCVNCCYTNALINNLWLIMGVYKVDTLWIYYHASPCGWTRPGINASQIYFHL